MSRLRFRELKMALLVLAAASVASCRYFDRQVPDHDTLLEKELGLVNWGEVDEFPTVEACDSVADKLQKRQCFLDFLVRNIQERLDAEPLKVLYPELDTVEMKVTIFPDSHVEFEPKLNDSLVYGKVKVDSILKARLADFPAVKPAIKRDIPVKTQFVLPVVLEVKK